MGAAVVGAGWHNWDQPAREKTARYGEFGSSGPGALNLGARVAWSKRLTADEANRLTPATGAWRRRQVESARDSRDQVCAPGERRAPAASPGSGGRDRRLANDDGDVGPHPSAARRLVSQRGRARIAENVVLWQRHTGGWPKNIDMARPLSEDERAKLRDEQKLDDSTIDNDATAVQLRFPRHGRRRPAARSSLLPCWPDSSTCSPRSTPTADGLSTFRCGKTTRATSPSTTTPSSTCSGFLAMSQPHERRSPDSTTRFALAHALPSNVATSRASDSDQGQWCADGLVPAVRREHAAARRRPHLRTSIHQRLETAAILTYLMKIDKPDAPTIAAIEAGMAWLVKSQIRGLRVEQKPDAAGPAGYDVVATPDAGAPPVWARFYDIPPTCRCSPAATASSSRGSRTSRSSAVPATTGTASGRVS
jgi:hypothetical protein